MMGSSIYQRCRIGMQKSLDQSRNAVDQRLHFRILQVQRREQPHHGIRSDVDQQTGCEPAYHEIAAGPVEFDADHQALAADFLDAGRSCQIPCDAFPDFLADPAGTFNETLVLDDGKGGQGTHTTQRVATEGGAVLARGEYACGGAARKTGADRETIAEPLRQGHDVRLDSEVLMGKPLAGPRHPRLHFIEHQQPSFFVADLAQMRDIAVFRNLDSALALHRFYQYRNDIRIDGRDLFECGQIVVGDTHKSCQQRFKPCLNLAAACGRQRCNGTAVERVLHYDDGRSFDTFLVTEKTRKLDRRFVGFTSRIAEESVVHSRKRAQTLGKLFLLGNFVEV